MIFVATVGDVLKDYGPLVALLGVAATLWINGAREERRRRRDLHARAIEAVVAYLQMPYRIRRRRDADDDRGAERARLSDEFSAVQAELASCESLILSDPDDEVRDVYEELVRSLREHAGNQATEAWNAPVITSDTQMGLRDVHDALAPVREQQERCVQAMAGSIRLWRL